MAPGKGESEGRKGGRGIEGKICMLHAVTCIREGPVVRCSNGVS